MNVRMYVRMCCNLLVTLPFSEIKSQIKRSQEKGPITCQLFTLLLIDNCENGVAIVNLQLFTLL